MGKYEKLYESIVENGDCDNVRFDDIKYLLERTGFSLRVNSGDHFRYSMEGIPELINIQPNTTDKKCAKSYQVRQIRNLFKRYNLGGRNHE